MPEAQSEALKHELAASRALLRLHAESLAERMNVGRRLRENIRRQPVVWVAGAVVLGLVVVALRPRVRRVEVRTKPAFDSKGAGKGAFFLAVGKLALDILSPTLISWARRRISPGQR